MHAGLKELLLCCLCWTAACDKTVAPLSRSGIANCGGMSLLSTPPLPLANVTGWVPLGNLNPVAHTFPTDQQYLYYTLGGATSLPVVAPSVIYVTRAKRTQYSTGLEDYSIEFQPCLEVKGEFGHISAIDATLASQLGAFDQ